MTSRFSRLLTLVIFTLLAVSCGKDELGLSRDVTAIEVKEALPETPTADKIHTATEIKQETAPPPAVTIVMPTVRSVVTPIVPTGTPTDTFSTPTPVPPTATPEVIIGPLNYPTGINPLTGQLVSDPAILQRRPLAIKISNYPRYVRPQSGLGVADMVWEHYAEGGTSRYTAVYYDSSADRVGPIRSARLIDLTLVDMLDSALVASGTSQGTLDRLWQKPWYAVVVTKANGYKCPPLCQESADTNSVFASTAAVWEALTSRGHNTPPTIQGLSFHELVPPEGQPGRLLRVDFSREAHSEWRYDIDSGRYRRWIDASASELEMHIDIYNGEQIATDNLVVLFANHVVDFTIPEDYYADGIHANFATEIQLWGIGKALLFRDGQGYVGSWVRGDAADMPSLFDNSGKPLPLRPGKTWIYTTHTGSEVAQTGGDWIISHLSPRDRGKLILPSDSVDN